VPVSIVHFIAAARPNFMKVAPLWHALGHAHDFEPVLIHTGQHYDRDMSENFLRDLGLPDPVFHLDVGSGTHAQQTAAVMVAYESVALDHRPDWLVVVGDVNSTLACALVGAKLRIPTVHLEAGLRSGDRDMPEEINRLATDVICDVLWTPSPDADENLRREGIPGSRISRVGNIMLDSLEMRRSEIEAARSADLLGLVESQYGIVTLHRPSNVDDAPNLTALVEALIDVQRRMPLVFPVHPRTKSRLREFGLEGMLERSGIRLMEPQSYISFMSLVFTAGLVLTDSGGLQEETTYLGIPCLTLRENTERPITIVEGTNQLVSAETIARAVDRILSESMQRHSRPALWDGRTAGRCVEDLRARGGAYGRAI
jgi:UDP-N-acetylglucosamine 2-epimerase (non-hydrolysing)